MKTQPSLTQWLVPRTFDLVCLLLYLGTLGVHVYFRVTNGCHECEIASAITIPIIAIGILLLVINDRVEYAYFGNSGNRRASAYFLAIRIVLILLIAVVDSFDFSLFLFLLIPFTAFSTVGPKVAYALTLLCWPLGYFLFYDITTGPIHDTAALNQVIFFIIYSFGLVFMLLMAQVVDQETKTRQRAEQLLQELALSHQQLREYSQRLAEVAVTEERNRLARDIHDSLGHFLTVINIQLEKALAFRKLKPEEADQAIRESKRLASEALMETRRSVGALRHQEQSFSLTKALENLVNDVNQGDIQVNLEIGGREEGFSYQSLMTLYRAAQEGLTNVQKHAKAETVTVKVNLGDAFAHLHVLDNGKGFDAARVPLHNRENGNYGLQGLQERLELIGGTIQINSQPGAGVCLKVDVPKNPLRLGT